MNKILCVTVCLMHSTMLPMKQSQLNPAILSAFNLQQQHNHVGPGSPDIDISKVPTVDAKINSCEAKMREIRVSQDDDIEAQREKEQDKARKQRALDRKRQRCLLGLQCVVLILAGIGFIVSITSLVLVATGPYRHNHNSTINGTSDFL